MARVTFPQSGLAVEVEPGVTLLDAARRAGLELEAPCNGQGTCGKCRVAVDRPDAVRRRGSSPHFHGPAERGWGGGGEAPGASVLSCETETTDADLVVTLPPIVRGRDRVLLTGERVERPHRPWVRREVDAAAGVTAILHGDARVAVRPGAARVLGLAVDVGTTTLVASLLDLEDGRELATVGALNPQTRLGHDVLSRIQAGSEPAGLVELHRLLADELNRMAAEALRRAGAHEHELQELVLAGNTAMLHLAARRDPRSLGKYPYTPALRGGTRHPATELGLRAAPEATVYLPPVFDGFVGADISAGAVACGLADLAGATLFIDIGTNGEMVLAVDGRLVATSTAAGPAFEGMNITFGMRAAPGAIEKVAVEQGGLRAATIGGTRPRGICGSGLVDAVAELVRTGLVDAGGRFARPERLPPELAALLVPYRGKNALLLAADADHLEGVVVLTQHDVRQVQLAKGAIRAGLDALLAHEGLTPDQVDRVLLAGSFGAHLRTESLVGIGLLPTELGDRVAAVGNTSRTGAEALLLDAGAREELQRAVDGATVIDLAHAPGFEAAFVAALGFPRAAAARAC